VICKILIKIQDRNYYEHLYRFTILGDFWQTVGVGKFVQPSATRVWERRSSSVEMYLITSDWLVGEKANWLLEYKAEELP